MKFEPVKLGKKEYDLIFKNINDSYITYCKIWLDTVEEKMNLKKIQIRHIYDSNINSVENISTKFESYMYSFMSGLDELYLEILFKLDIVLELSDKVKFTGRIKKQESIVDKIYRKMKEQNGAFSINKYLNDLLGFRIIDPYYKDNIDTINELIDSYKEIGLNIIGMYRCNNGYEAYHIYIKYCNNTFPIEIQIWDKEKEHSNIEFHKVYKQGYVGSIIENYDKF